MLDDNRLLSLVKSGDAESFGAILERYQSPVFRYLYRLTGNYDTALDLRQDTFIRAYKGIMNDEIRVSFKAWLYKLATNNARQFFRRKRILSFIPLKENQAKETAKSGEDPSELIAKRIDVRKALAGIPLQQRVCMVLHFVEGFKYREIAETLEISEEAVRKRVARGSQEFRRLYGPEEVNRNEV